MDNQNQQQGEQQQEQEQSHHQQPAELIQQEHSQQQQINQQQYYGVDQGDGQYGDQNDDDIYDKGYSNPLQTKQSKANVQYNIQNLYNRIVEQTNRIMGITNLSYDWSLLIYYSCRWSQQLLIAHISSSADKLKEIIHYTAQFQSKQGESGIGECALCCESQRSLFRNICGHQFCKECWQDYIIRIFKEESGNPFPTCMVGEDCQTKISETLIKQLAKSKPFIIDIYKKSLCQSYGTQNKSVKICKGRPGHQCNKFFGVLKMYVLINCENCGNLICPRCGKRFHGPSACHQIKNWEKMTQQKMQFLQFFNFKKCPACQAVLERTLGCNFMKCKCRQQFCYVCGDKWFPAHQQHMDTACPKYQQSVEMSQLKQKKYQNNKQFLEKIQQTKERLNPIKKQIEHMQKLREKIPQLKSTFLKNFDFYFSHLAFIDEYMDFYLKCLYCLQGELIGFHFNMDKKNQFFVEQVREVLKIIKKFLTDFIQKMYNYLQVDYKQLSEIDRKTFDEMKINFKQELIQKSKQNKEITQRINKQITQIE